MTRVFAAVFTLVLATAFAHAAGDFTIVALPDTQIYAKSYPHIFAAETRWIAEHAAEQNIQLVLGLGDIVDGGGQIAQWQNADAAIRNIDRKVPFMLAIGNHDYDRNNPAGRTASAQNYNAYFGPQRFRDRAWYGGSYPSGSNENFYGTFNFEGRPYLVIMLECFPRDSALNWAASVIKKHPSSDVIIVTHAYTYFDNTRLDRCDSNSAASFGVASDNDGQQVWEKFVRKHPNIVMVLSGHVVQGDGTGRRSDLGEAGNLVNQMVSDYQAYENGGNGYIRLITIRPATNQILVRTYSPYLDRYLTDDHNQFTLQYRSMGLPSGSAKLSGMVKNAIDCSPMKGIAVTTPAGSAITDASGRFEVEAAGPASYSMETSIRGYGSGYKVVGSAIPHHPGPAKVLLSTKGLLKGRVSRGGAPLGSSTVTISGGLLRIRTAVTTASDGGFSAGWLPVGKYQLRVSIAGQQVATAEGTVNTGETTQVSIAVRE